ncbi:MAG: hypothetical protein MK108_05730 [Mariniblastus sp.]|nr:hypothetical protein [Mariniblastus sp.]
MKETRRFVTRIDPQRRSTFDQQFWPVLVAIVVLSGMLTGAIVTLLRGVWMWGSLLVLPAAVVVAVFVLYRLDNRRLRRSLQLALVISLAVHMVVLMVASATEVFNNPFQAEQPRVAQRPQKTITIRNRTTPFVWQKSQQKPTPEKEVELKRQQAETTVEQPQPTPVEKTERNPQPQVVRREQNRPTVPRLDQQLSELRRQEQDRKPRSSVNTSAAPREVVQQVPAPSSQSESAPSRVETGRRSAESSAERAAQRNAPITKSRQLSPVAPRRTKPVESAESTARHSTRTSERPTNRQSPRLAEVTATRPESARPQVNSPARAQPTEMSRRPAETNRSKPEVAVSTVNTRTLTRSAQRRVSEVRQPTLSSPESNLARPRRSIINSPVAQTTAKIESPSLPNASATSARNPAAQAFAVSKSTTGQAGSGQSANLAKGAGSLTSPTRIASTATAERRTDSRSDSAVSLSSQQKSFQGRRTATDISPQSTVRATTEFNARLAGSRQPRSRALNASASRVDSRSTAERSESSAEKGSSNLELGPTKVVMEEISQRRGGGGQPELSESKSETDSPSGRTAADQVPTIMAEASGNPQTVSQPRSAPMSSEKNQPDSIANRVTRSQLDTPATRGLNGQSESAESAATASLDPQQSGRRATDATQTALADLDGQRESGSSRAEPSSRPAVSPDLAGQADFGQPDANQGSRLNRERLPGESTTADVQQRSANAEAASSLQRSEASGMLQAARPVADAGSGAGRRPADDPMVDQDRAARSNDRSGRSITVNKPNLSAVADLETGPATQRGSGSPSVAGPRLTQVMRDQAEIVSQGPGAAVRVDAPEGPAGLGETPSVRLGIRSRPSSADSPNIAAQTETRFKRPDFGGLPALNPAAVLAKNAFRSRSPGAVANAAPSTEAAIQSGLEFLARHQREEGGWSLSGFDQDSPLNEYQIESDTAATGLAVLAFQGAGYNHREFKYAGQLQRALQWMVDHQQADGGLYVEANSQSNASARMYSHAIAALALTEAYGMTQDSDLERAAQKALDYISATQDPQRGGWRYYADPQLRSSDTSVTGWMMMALKSGQLAGLKVRPRTLQGIESWLQVAVDADTGSQFRYNPYAVDGQQISRAHGRQVSPSMTAVGLLMRVYSGWPRDDQRFLAGAESLLKQLPSDANTRLRDTYYWYYATQVLKHAGGESWETWNQALHPLLVRTQVKSGELSGSWHPYRPVPDRWGAHGGRLYVTTLNLLSLEVRYRLLPLYENTVNQEEGSPAETR